MKRQLLYSLLCLFIGLQIGNAKTHSTSVLLTPPENDECSNAISVPVNPTLETVSFVSGTTLGATYSPVPVSCAVPNQVDVWYSFVATSTVQFVKFYNLAYSTPANSLSYQVFSGINCATMTPVACYYGEQNIVNNLVVGQTYKMRVYYSNLITTFTFDLAISHANPIVNDECTTALVIPVNEGSSTDLFLNTTDLGATGSPYISNCFNGEHDTWYRFTAANSVQVIRFFDLDNSQINKTFSLFTGVDCSSLTPVTCGLEGVLENLTVGTTYTLRILKNTINSPSLSSFKIQINTTEPLVNDDCEDAITIVANPDLQKNFFISGTTIGATASNSDTTDRDVFYRFIATSTQHLIYFDNLINTFQFELLEENSICANSDLLYNYSGIGYNSIGTVYHNFIVGNPYLIRVKSASGEIPSLFDLSVRTHEIVPNGECINAIDVPVNPTESCEVFATGITQAGFFETAPFYNPNDSTWYRFVATSETHAIEFEDLDDVFLETNYQLYNNDACDTNQSIAYVPGLQGFHNNLVIGNEYIIRLNSQNHVAPVSGEVKVCITTIPQPANDECDNATTLQVNAVNQVEYYVNSSTFGATNSDIENTCGGLADDDVWFSFVATSKFHTITLSNVTPITNNLKFIAYEGADCNNLSFKKCGGISSMPLNTLTIGQTYKIRVFTEGLAPNKFAGFTIAVATTTLAVNDECSNAILVPTSTISDLNVIEASVKGASQSSEQNNCEPEADDDIWYAFIATATRHFINFNWTSNYPFFVSFSVYSGDCNNLTEVYCSDVGVNTINDLVIGQTYKIRFWTSSSTPSNTAYKLIITNQDEPLVANTTQFTPQELVSDILINDPCISVSNITSSTGTNFGSVNGIGYFTNDNPLFPISSGIVLSTGNAANAGGPNPSTSSEGNTMAWSNANDADLNAAMLAATGIPLISRNTTKLEFDFTSQNEFMSFNFLFASEDYGTYQCFDQDAFAFLLTDLTTGITTNLAIVPGTLLPISVTTIRSDQYNSSCPSMNNAFFDAVYSEVLSEGLGIFSPTNFSGQTALMTASSSVIPDNPYHIKMVIADRGSITYDSAVFIQAGSFSSGPPQCLDKIELVSFIDSNNNGIKEDTESIFTSGSFVYQLNDIGENIAITSTTGMHTIYDTNPLNSYDFSYVIQPEFAAYFSAGTTTFSNSTVPVGSGTQTLYFPITEVQTFSDVTVSIIPIGQPVAGSTYANKIVYQNLGNSPASGTIIYTKDTSVTISSSESGAIITPTGFTYNFANLAPFETRSFNIQINVPPSPQNNTTSTTFLDNDIALSSSIAIAASVNDTNINDNSFQITQTVGSITSSNDKTEAHGEILNIGTFTQDDYLFYTIRFQNLKTTNAINLRVDDVLDAQLDETSVRMVSASHNYKMEQVGNQLSWNLDYIYLPSQFANDNSSRGYITFKVKVKPGFVVDDVIPNTAEIYFDGDASISTNTFESRFEVDLNTNAFSTNNILLYPNPTNAMLHINLQNTNESLKSMVVYDMIGKTIKTISGNNAQQASINVGNLAKGVYMIEITTDSNLKQVRKFIAN
ncbi:choice-of-anchor L domain-containing protein [Flavobacterium sp. SM2513]|uniref:choice-of-anchor L domain-containing protein n=1 Tax=Flavobacterium sp. SM2513 TaxID=3424766 RepID=UPI003D7FB8E9